MDNKHTEIITHLTEVKTEVKGINKRLDRINGKVAEHEKEIHDLDKSTDSLFKEFSRVYTDVDSIKKNKKKWLNFWIERAFWILLVLASWIVISTGIVNPPSM